MVYILCLYSLILCLATFVEKNGPYQKTKLLVFALFFLLSLIFLFSKLRFVKLLLALILIVIPILLYLARVSSGEKVHLSHHVFRGILHIIFILALL